MKDYYKILGVKEDASADEIRDRWIEMMQEFHPDHGSGKEGDEEIAKEVNEAYQVLKHSSTRMEYDFARLHQRGLKKFSTRKLILPISGLIFVLILSFILMKKPQVSTPLKSKPQLPSSPQAEWSPIPQYEPGPYVTSAPHISKPEKVAKVEKGEKVVLQKVGQEIKTGRVIPKKEIETPPQRVPSKDSFSPPPISASKEQKPPASNDSQRDVKTPGPPEKISVVRHIFVPSPSIKTEDQVAEAKPSPLIATEEEVKQFFANYIERYTQKDIQGFLSLFSSKAIQNQKDGLEGIRRIYENFFGQSQELTYHIEDTKIEIYQNAVEIKARYEVNQIFKKDGDKKGWKGNIQWVLVKEGGALKIISVNYKHHSLP